ncbi:MAG TPA: 4'-phosphopantetheinyl transferase superfamily protein [Candidatus Enterocola sp.]|nr:MAG: holo-(acyl carrier protein) synthase 2 [Bacteroidetes bacterium ADurb.Bin174]HOH96646.1 4'-phosphopantetheinyl transferase superfamily protein [Candidatus Enterocola sp.]HQB28721.1 4'-phosphopantetheinyl transferase superfamily protein [Paludibacter sp.]
MKIENITYQEGEILIGQFDEDVEALKSMLTNFEVYEAEFEKLSTTKRKQEFLAARLLLNKVLGREVVVCYDENNKPYLQNASEQISISHSKNYVAVMVHPIHAVGIDLELRTEKVKRVYKRFLNPAEQQYLYNEKDNSYLEIAWSAKEVLYKLIGKKVFDFSTELEIFPFQLNDSGVLHVLHVSGSRIYRLHYFQNATYTMVVGVDKKIKL